MKLTPWVLFFATLGVAWAQDDSDLVSLSPFAVTSPERGELPAVSLKRRADFVSVPVTLESKSREAGKRIADYRATVKAMVEAAKGTPHLRVLNGDFSLSGANRGSFFKLSSGDSESSVVVRVVGKITDGDSVFDRAAEVRALVDGLRLPEGLKAYVGQTSLGVVDPDQYRPELVKAIAEDMKLVTAELGEKTVVQLRGLDGRVQVRQIDEQNVRLYIAYSYAQILIGHVELLKLAE